MDSSFSDQYEGLTHQLSATVKALSELNKEPRSLISLCPQGLPSLQNVKEIMSLLWKVIFPELFFERLSASSRFEYRIGVATERLFELLTNEIAIGLSCIPKQEIEKSESSTQADSIALDIISHLPEIKRALFTDIRAIMHKDPAAGNEVEIILCYPSVKAMLHHRLAHYLFSGNIPYLPRIISELAHSQTGIDIHPGATIGESFAIDHGTGVVIGETCIIGKNVTLYQGVTLGAKSFQYNEDGAPLNVPRHPIIEDNVTIYSNASVLGRITIGHDSIIGGNVWVTQDVPPGSRVVQEIPRL